MQKNISFARLPLHFFLLGLVLLLVGVSCGGAQSETAGQAEEQVAAEGSESSDLGDALSLQSDEGEEAADREPAPGEPAAESSPEPAATADVSPPGRIAYIGPNGRLNTVAPDGENGRRLSSRGLYQFPAWSPTADTIAVIGTTSEEAGVFVVSDREDSELQSVYTHSRRSPIYLYWTPDGEAISFIAQHPNGLALHLAPADGTAQSKVLSTGQPFYWQWLPDGERILIHTDSSHLAYLDREGNRDETALAEEGFFQAPALSPSGRYVAFSDAVGEVADEEPPPRGLVVQDIEDDTEAFSKNHLGVLAMSWSPTQDKLAYISPTENQATFFGPLSVLDMQTGESQLIVADDVVAFFWSPDGQKLAFITFRDQNQQAVKGRRAKPAQQRGRPFLTLSVLDVQSGGQRTLLRFQPTLIFVTQFIPFFDQYALSHRIWSPDSRYLVLPAVNEESEPEITVIPTDGRAPAVIAEGIAAFWSQQ